MNDDGRKNIKNKVLLCLKTYPHKDKICLPLPIKSFVKTMSNCKLIKYSTHMKKFNFTYEEMLKYAGTVDAFTDYDASSNLYLVYYNDIDVFINESNRYRWNIAHELGHIALNHHRDNNKTRIFRNELSKSEYKGLEDEADMFASYILSPYAPLYCLKIYSSESLKTTCKISKAAATIRFGEYKKWIQNSSVTEPYDFALCRIFIKRVTCPKCGSSYIPQKQRFCLICGNDKLIYKGEYGMAQYNKIDLNERGKAKICPNCQNEDTDIDGEWCQICGKQLVNKCKQQIQVSFNEWLEESPCCENAKTLQGNARYCPYCGSKTTFLENGLLKKWQDSQISKTEAFSVGDFEEIDTDNRKSQEFDEIDTDDSDLPF